MRLIRSAAPGVTVRKLGETPAPVVPQIAIKMPRGSVVECPTDQQLVSDILRQVPRLRRPNRNDGYTHVSDLIGKGKCMRQIAIARKYGTPLRPKRLGVFDRITFAIGDAVHDTMKMIATEGGPSAVWGNWKCSCGHLYHTDPCVHAEIDPEDVCELCGTPCNVYQEVPMFNEEYQIVGNPDLMLFLDDVGAFHIVELKSMKHEDFLDLSRPLPEHILQVVFYWFLVAMTGRKVTDRVSIVYITKGYQFKGEAHKEFMIDPRRELHRLEPYLADALRAKMSREHEVYPERKVCSGEYTTQAKKCEVCSLCFTLPA